MEILSQVKAAVTKDHVLCDSISCEMSRIGKSIETESRLVFAYTCRGGEVGAEKNQE